MQQKLIMSSIKMFHGDDAEVVSKKIKIEREMKYVQFCYQNSKCRWSCHDKGI